MAVIGPDVQGMHRLASGPLPRRRDVHPVHGSRGTTGPAGARPGRAR